MRHYEDEEADRNRSDSVHRRAAASQPCPIPGVRLGLANAVTVCAVYRYRVKETTAILTTRILPGCMFSGNMMTLAGGALCLLGTLALRRILPPERLRLSSVFGADPCNIGQLFAAIAVVRTPDLLADLPFLILPGCLAGNFTGLCALLAIHRLSKIENGPTEER